MTTGRGLIQIWLLGVILLVLPAAVQAQFALSTNADGSLNIVFYTGDVIFTGYASTVNIPGTIVVNGASLPVTSIGDQAFDTLAGWYLTNVTFPNSVTKIGSQVFYGCGRLAGVTLPDNLTSIGDSDFWGCGSLTFITIPGSVTNIGASAFELAGLTNVSIPDSVISIGASAFEGTSLTSIIIPDSVISIGDGVFESCQVLTNVTLGNGLTSIGVAAFAGTALTNVILPDSLISIGAAAFSDCLGLASVTIPNSVTSIGTNAFVRSASLTNIMVNAGNPAYSSLNGVLFDKAQMTVVEFPDGLSGSYMIPSGVTRIGESAFGNCAGLTSITIPDGVTNIGAAGFLNCSLTNVVIPGSVTSIGDAAFESTGLSSVTMSNGVISIGAAAFFYCVRLNSVTIPASVTSIGDDVFRICGSLTNIAVDASNPAYSSSNGVLFDKAQMKLIVCPNGLGGNYAIPGGVTTIEAEAFYYGSLTSVTIPDSVTSIGAYAFENCGNLTSVTIGNGVTNIGNNAFEGTPLTSIIIPDSVTSIGEDAFSSSSLTNATFGNSVNSIGDGAFGGCNLTSVIIPASVTNIGNGAFEFNYYLKSAYFLGNAPAYAVGYIFWDDDKYGSSTVYYLPGTTGWGATSGNEQAVLWNPQILTGDGSFGVQNNQFGFNISGTSSLVIVIATCTNLENPIWIAVGTNTLSTVIGTNGTSYFSDPQWTNYPVRFYRLRPP